MENEIQKALAGLLIIQNENLKVQNPTIYRGFKQAQDALTEVLKPTSEDKYIIAKGDKYYCQYANGKKAFEVTEAINNTRDLEVIKFGFTEAKMLTGSTLYGDACFNAEMIKLYPEVSGNIEQLKEVVQELESDHTCTHPHWEETPTKNIIIKTCSTCGAQKYE